jgi:molybdopterin molybdotransferase
MPVNAAVGRVLARAVRSPRAQPLFDNSAMDGFCVTSAYTSMASASWPVKLRVLGSIAAGDAPPEYDEHTPDDVCYEIMTGASFPIPSAATLDLDTRKLDACVRIERVHLVDEVKNTSQPKVIYLTSPVLPCAERRRAGEDYAAGDLVLEAGSVINAHHLLPLIGVGLTQVIVRKRPRVVIITTGKELRSLHITLRDATDARTQEAQASSLSIPNSNGPYLASACAAWGCEVVSVVGVDDDPEDFHGALRSAIDIAFCDIIVTTGGVSKGKHDYVRDLLEHAGAKIKIAGVKIRPGGPAVIAEWQDMSVAETGGRRRPPVPVFSLPGNPTAAALCARVLIVPFIRKWLGRPKEKPWCARLGPSPMQHTLLTACSPHMPCTKAQNSPRRSKEDLHDIFLRAMPTRRFIPSKLEWMANGPEVCMLRSGGGIVSSLTEADVWVNVEEDQDLYIGDWVECLPTRCE